MSELLVYRNRWSRLAAILLLSVCIAAVAASLWDTRILPFAFLSCALAWFAALAWVLPFVRLDEDGVVVRNAFSTVTIPYDAVTGVTGGSRLEIEARGGLKVVADAVPGRGNFTINAVRKRDTYGAFFIPVTSVNDLRIDVGEGDTPADRVAQTLRRRVATAKSASGSAAARRVNVSAIAGSIAIIAVFLVGLLV